MQEENSNKKRTDFLTIICIFSFIGGGLSAFSNLVIFLSYDQIGELMPEIERMMENFNLSSEDFNKLMSGGKNYFLAGGILNIISVSGIARMWKLKKIGFHFYVAAQIFLFILPMVTFENLPFNFFGLLITVFFIYAYSTQLKHMS